MSWEVSENSSLLQVCVNHNERLPYSLPSRDVCYVIRQGFFKRCQISVQKWEEGEVKLGCVPWDFVLSISALSWLVLVWKRFTSKSILWLTVALCFMDIESRASIWFVWRGKVSHSSLSEMQFVSFSVFHGFWNRICVLFATVVTNTEGQETGNYENAIRTKRRPDVNPLLSHEHHNSTCMCALG